jgi:hypothetical protein
MYPAGKVAISQHLATPGFPQSDYTIGRLSAYAGSLCTLISLINVEVGINVEGVQKLPNN